MAVAVAAACSRAASAARVGALGACEPEVTLAGGTYVDLSPTESLVDGTMVSAKGWTALAPFVAAFVLYARERSQEHPDEA